MDSDKYVNAMRVTVMMMVEIMMAMSTWIRGEGIKILMVLIILG